MFERQLKALSRAVTLECYTNGFARALREIENAYRDAWGDGRVCCGAQGISKHLTEYSMRGLGRNLRSSPYG